MKDDLEQQLRSLHLRKIAEIFDDEVRRAEKADSSYQELAARLFRAQWQANQKLRSAGASSAPASPSSGRSRPFLSSASSALIEPDPDTGSRTPPLERR